MPATIELVGDDAAIKLVPEEGGEPTRTYPDDVEALESGKAAKAANLSDLTDASAARTNLGLGTAATYNVPASGNAASGEVVKGSDTRLTDNRTPTAHASTHAAAGSDPVTLAQSQVTNLTTDLAARVQVAGQIGGTASSPDVRGLRETGGPTLLTMGAVADGQNLRRSGSTIVGATPATTMTGASSGSAGTSGLVPQPSAGDQGKFLRGDATWASAGGTMHDVMSRHLVQWHQVVMFSQHAQGTTGSGNISFQDARWKRAHTGTTAGSTAGVVFLENNTAGFSHGKNYDILNWSKAMTINLVIMLTLSTTNGKSTVVMGTANATGSDSPTNVAGKAIGIRVDNLALKGIVHNGTSATDVDLSTTLVLNRTYAVSIYADGTGNVTWYVGGTQAGTTASGPTGDSIAVLTSLGMGVQNGADANFQDLYLQSAHIAITQ